MSPPPPLFAGHPFSQIIACAIAFEPRDRTRPTIADKIISPSELSPGTSTNERSSFIKCSGKRLSKVGDE
jgi:hypothetical protein